MFSEKIGTLYPSYTNGEKERFVCLPSRERDIHDGYDRTKQCVKSADVWGIEKVCGALYEAARQHGDFQSKKSDSNSKDFP